MLRREEIHGALSAPALESMNFLNEIMSRYPAAISFAPGAPNPSLMTGLDLNHYIERYVEHLETARGLERDAARRLLCEYGPSRGIINDLVSQALHRDYGLDVAATSVVITVGTQEAMFLVLHALFASPADVLAVATPCYVGILGSAKLLNISIVPIPESADGLDLRRLAEAVREVRASGRRIRALYVAPDFANPSGTTMSLEARRELLQLAEREDLIVLEDGAYGFTAEPGFEIVPLKALDVSNRVILLGTFSKVCMPGVRVGFVVADQAVRGADGTEVLLANMLAAAKSMVSVNTSPICQGIVGGMLLEHGVSIAALGETSGKLYRQNLLHLLESLDRELSGVKDVTWNRPKGGFFIRVTLPVPADFELLERSASAFGVLWTPMSLFHLDGSGDNEMRLSCSYLTLGQIEAGVERLGQLVRSVQT
jgi:(S)-3,5-dihydroxyphenylglycine transaminase